MNILQIRSSARGHQSHSTQLANRLVDALRARHPGASVTVRDLAQFPLPQLDAAAIGALFSDEQQRSPGQAVHITLSDSLIAELQAADTVVLGVPMYNFGIPVQLKNWIDAIARKGITFRYTERGPEGLLTGKKLYVALARGGRYRNTPADTQVPYLRLVLGFLGLTDVEFIYAEGLTMGPDAERQAYAEASAQIRDAVERSMPELEAEAA